jgi:hypothetical protein
VLRIRYSLTNSFSNNEVLTTKKGKDRTKVFFTWLAIAANRYRGFDAVTTAITLCSSSCFFVI